MNNRKLSIKDFTVKNSDNSIVHIPTYKIMEEPFLKGIGVPTPKGPADHLEDFPG